MKKFIVIGILLILAVPVIAGTPQTIITAYKESATCWTYEVYLIADKGPTRHETSCFADKATAKADMVLFMTKIKQYDSSVKTSGVIIEIKDLTVSESLE